jgi:phosphatidylglycerophosphate synthase
MRIADVFTASRVVAAPVIMWLILSDEPLAAYYLFAAAAITDYLDGYFARRSKKIAAYGAVFDGVADIFLLILTGVALLIRGEALSLFVVGVIGLVLTAPVLWLISRKKGRPTVPHLDTNILAAFVYPTIMAYIIGWRYALPLLLVTFAIGLYTYRKYVVYAWSIYANR